MHFDACSAELAPDDGSVLHVEAHERLHFLLPCIGIHRFCAALNDVAHTVELGALPTVPKPPKLHL